MLLRRILLMPFSLLYAAVVYLRNILYNTGILSSYKVPVKSIVVGNLAVGGTGKTPHIEYLIRILKDHNVAVLSRGYRRNTKGTVEASVAHTFKDVGDEPYQLKRKFPHIPVVVDANRTRGVKYILSQHPQTRIILLDDALQHRRITAGLNLLLTTCQRPFTSDFYLPSGTLRDWKGRAKDADIIIVTKCPERENRVEWARRLHTTGIPTFVSAIRYGNIEPLHPTGIAWPEVRQVVLLTGIANPAVFAAYVASQLTVVKHLSFPDHYAFSREDVLKIREIFDTFDSAKTAVLTTEKDAMRLLHPQLNDVVAALPVFYWPIKVDLGEGTPEFEHTILDYAGKN